MEHERIRFKLLFHLYQRHYSEALGHPQNTEEVIVQAGVQFYERNLINGNIVYLKDMNYVDGPSTIGLAYPFALRITSYGIDFVNERIERLMDILRNDPQLQERFHTISGTSSFSGRMSEIGHLLSQNQELIDRIMRP